jgi:hypothetical protein
LEQTIGAEDIEARIDALRAEMRRTNWLERYLQESDPGPGGRSLMLAELRARHGTAAMPAFVREFLDDIKGRAPERAPAVTDNRPRAEG